MAQPPFSKLYSIPQQANYQNQKGGPRGMALIIADNISQPIELCAYTREKFVRPWVKFFIMTDPCELEITLSDGISSDIGRDNKPFILQFLPESLSTIWGKVCVKPNNTMYNFRSSATTYYLGCQFSYQVEPNSKSNISILIFRFSSAIAMIKISITREAARPFFFRQG